MHSNITLCNETNVVSQSRQKQTNIGFWCTSGNMINQLDVCQLEEDKVFHIHVKICDKKAKEFVWQKPNPPTKKISNSEKVTKLRLLNMYFNDIEAIIKSMWYSIVNMHELQLHIKMK